MNLINTKAIMRKYYLRCVLILIPYLVIIIPCIFFWPNIWSVLLSVIIYLPVKLLIRIVANKTIASVLFSDLDAIGFQELLKVKHFIPPLSYRLNATLCTGDYQTTINIGNTQIHKKASINTKYSSLGVLALTYFELRDFDKLQELLAKYDEYSKKHPSKAFVYSCSVWSYYRYFLEHNFEACKTVCKERNSVLKPKAWDSKVRKLQNDYLYAVACYEKEEFDEAKKYFENIISNAPRMHFATLSEKYLVAIDQETQVVVCDEKIIPDLNYQFVENKKFKIIRLIKNISLVIVVAALIVLRFIPGPKEISEYDKKLQTALSQQYTNFEVLAYMNVEENDVVKDVVVFVKDETGEIDVGFIVSYDNGVSFDVKIIESNISYGTYVLTSFTGEHSIYLSIYDHHINGNDNYSNRKFDCLGKKYFVYAKCDE